MFQCTTGEHVKEAEKRSLGTGKKGSERFGIDSWRRDIHSYPVHSKQGEGSENPLA
jgi:hypothetical protein